MNNHKQICRRAVLLSIFMASTGLLAKQLKPTKRLSDELDPPDLESLIPKKFGEWTALAVGSSGVVNPVVQKELAELYAGTLSRTYSDGDGYRLMLSIAYGSDQSRDLQVHRPEVCYVAQGFKVTALRKVELRAGGFSIPAMRMESSFGARQEPVTYWVRIGNKVVRGNIEQGLARLEYGMSGYIPDGLLFRVSSLDENIDSAYRSQEKFVQELFSVLTEVQRQQLVGSIRL